jgi:hypothetical protein
MMEKEKSLGIVIISWIEMMVGGFLVSITAIVLSYNFLTYIVKKPDNYIDFLVESILAGILYIIVFGLTFLAGMLTSNLKPAGRTLNLFLSSCCILIYVIWALHSDLIKYFFEGLFTLPWLISYAPIILSVCFIIFFNDSKVKEQFK